MTDTPNAGLEGLVGLSDDELCDVIEMDSMEAVRIIRYLQSRPQPGAEGDARDAARWRHARKILPVEFIEQAQDLYEAFGVEGDETENLKADAAIDTALASRRELGGVSGEGK